jgi:adenylate cyclase
MGLENFFNHNNVIDLSFFNFRNAITAAYLADQDLKVLKINDNFVNFPRLWQRNKFLLS